MDLVARCKQLIFNIFLCFPLSAIVEVIPAAYVDYTFQLLSESCKISYYELHGTTSGGTLCDLLIISPVIISQKLTNLFFRDLHVADTYLPWLFSVQYICPDAFSR